MAAKQTVLIRYFHFTFEVREDHGNYFALFAKILAPFAVKINRKEHKVVRKGRKEGSYYLLLLLNNIDEQKKNCVNLPL